MTIVYQPSKSYLKIIECYSTQYIIILYMYIAYYYTSNSYLKMSCIHVRKYKLTFSQQNI